MGSWYTAVHNLPAAWPEISTLGSENLRKVVGIDFHEIRKKFNASKLFLIGTSSSFIWKLLDLATTQKPS